jgi:hypothetical protein
MQTATCLGKYVNSSKFYQMCNLFLDLAERCRPDFPRSSETIQLAAEKFAKAETISSLEAADEIELDEWFDSVSKDWLSLIDERDVRIYFLDPPSEKLTNKLGMEPERAKAIEEACQIMAFDTDEEKRFQAQRHLTKDLIRTYFDMKVINRRAYIAIRHYFPPLTSEYIYVGKASQEKGQKA